MAARIRIHVVKPTDRPISILDMGNLLDEVFEPHGGVALNPAMMRVVDAGLDDSQFAMESALLDNVDYNRDVARGYSW